MSDSRAGQYNRETYDRLWEDLAPFTRYNPGSRHRRRWLFAQLDALTRAGAVRSVLDVGCGNAETLRLARARYPKVERWVGVDLSAETVRRNAERYEGFEFLAADLHREAPPVRADVVLCSEVVEHMDDRAQGFAHLVELLAPRGHLLLTTPTGHVFATEKYFGHTTHPTREELLGYARAHGLATVSLTNWGFPLYRALKWATNVDPDWALRNFAAPTYGPAQVLVSQALYAANFLNAADSPWGCQLYAHFAAP